MTGENGNKEVVRKLRSLRKGGHEWQSLNWMFDPQVKVDRRKSRI